MISTCRSSHDGSQSEGRAHIITLTPRVRMQVKSRLHGECVVKALFFDLDGTLVDVTRREMEVIYDTANHFGLRVSRTKVKQLHSQMPSSFDALKKLDLELTEDVEQYWTSAFIGKYRLSVVRRGAESSLKALSEKYKLLCVTSRATLAEVIRELTFLQIDGLFNHVVARDVGAKHFGVASLPLLPFHEQRRKLYECALEIAKCGPKSAVVIGDMGSELRPAKELGITTIGLVTHEAKKRELQGTSDSLISNFSQLPNLLLEAHRYQPPRQNWRRP